jgi:hypothetical protein
MSKAFIESQIAYYRRHLGCGNFHDRNMIVGLLHYYEAELRKINSVN